MDEVVIASDTTDVPTTPGKDENYESDSIQDIDEDEDDDDIQVSTSDDVDENDDSESGEDVDVDDHYDKKPPAVVKAVKGWNGDKRRPKQTPSKRTAATTTSTPRAATAAIAIAEVASKGGTSTNGLLPPPQKYHALRKSKAFTGPIIFLSWDDCLKYVHPSDQNDTATPDLQSFDSILDALEFVTLSLPPTTTTPRLRQQRQRLLHLEEDVEDEQQPSQSSSSLRKKRSHQPDDGPLNQPRQRQKKTETVKQDDEQPLNQPQQGPKKSTTARLPLRWWEMDDDDDDDNDDDDDGDEEEEEENLKPKSGMPKGTRLPETYAAKRVKEIELHRQQIEAVRRKKEKAWEENYELLKAYKVEHGNC